MAVGTYRSKDGQHYFQFEFLADGERILIFCRRHPVLGNVDPDPHKTHLFPSGRVCIAEGKDPTNVSRAQELATQWAEYFLEYRRTGIAQQ